MSSTAHTVAPSPALIDSFYIDCSLPIGVMIPEYRRSRPHRPSLWKRLTLRPA